MTPSGRVLAAACRATGKTGRNAVAITDTERWPSIPVADWRDTRDTLHLYTQVVGKVRLANEARLNHWWNVPLYVSARGLTTSLMPHPSGPAFQIDFRLPRAPPRHRKRHGRASIARLGVSPVAESTPPRCPSSTTSAWRPSSGRCRWRSPTRSRSRMTGCTPPTTPRQCAGSGSRSSRSSASSSCSGTGSSASPARCTCSGDRLTSRSPASPAGPRRRTQVAHRAAGRA